MAAAFAAAHCWRMTNLRDLDITAADYKSTTVVLLQLQHAVCGA
jgi:hypothetical protein